MTAALQGVPPAGLPYGIWHSPNPFAAPPGVPVATNGGGSFLGIPIGFPASQPPAQNNAPLPIRGGQTGRISGNGQAQRGDLLPPAPIPDRGGFSASDKTFFGLF